MRNIDDHIEEMFGISNRNSRQFNEMRSIFESNSKDKQDMFNAAIKEMQEWTKKSSSKNKEIYDTKGDITKFDPDLKEVIDVLSKSEDLNSAPDMTNIERNLIDVKGLYSHFMLHKNTYIHAFKSGNETVKTIYISGTWLLITVLADLCAHFGTRRVFSKSKYSDMITKFNNVISHPKFIEYVNTADDLVFNTESILYEDVFAVGTTIVSFIVALRLVVWNMYMMRTKLSDKLKVTAEFLEKNANRLKASNKKDKDKIAAKQLKAVDTLSRISEKLRIKMDDDTYSNPPPIKMNKETTPTIEDDEDDDIEL